MRMTVSNNDDVSVPDKLVSGVHPLSQYRDKGNYIKLFTLRHDVLEKSIKQLRSILDILIWIRHHLGDGAKDFTEHWQNILPGNLDNVVETLACIISHPAVWVTQTYQYWVY